MRLHYILLATITVTSWRHDGAGEERKWERGSGKSRAPFTSRSRTFVENGVCLSGSGYRRAPQTCNCRYGHVLFWQDHIATACEMIGITKLKFKKDVLLVVTMLSFACLWALENLCVLSCSLFYLIVYTVDQLVLLFVCVCRL